MHESTENIGIQKPQRPDGLTFIAVLSFIGGGFSFISNFTIYSLYHEVIQAIEDGQVMELPNVDMNMVSDLLVSSGRVYYLIVALVYLVSLFGVYKMWHMQKRGIHFYAIAQIVLLILPLLFIDTNLSVFPGLIITVLFIYIYSRYQKLMQ